jgi:hypothetical protein
MVGSDALGLKRSSMMSLSAADIDGGTGGAVPSSRRVSSLLSLRGVSSRVSRISNLSGGGFNGTVGGGGYDDTEREPKSRAASGVVFEDQMVESFQQGDELHHHHHQQQHLQMQELHDGYMVDHDPDGSFLEKEEGYLDEEDYGDGLGPSPDLVLDNAGLASPTMVGSSVVVKDWNYAWRESQIVEGDEGAMPGPHEPHDEVEDEEILEEIVVGVNGIPSTESDFLSRRASHHPHPNLHRQLRQQQRPYSFSVPNHHNYEQYLQQQPVQVNPDSTALPGLSSSFDPRRYSVPQPDPQQYHAYQNQRPDSTQTDHEHFIPPYDPQYMQPPPQVSTERRGTETSTYTSHTNTSHRTISSSGAQLGEFPEDDEYPGEYYQNERQEIPPSVGYGYLDSLERQMHHQHLYQQQQQQQQPHVNDASASQYPRGFSHGGNMNAPQVQQFQQNLMHALLQEKQNPRGHPSLAFAAAALMAEASRKVSHSSSTTSAVFRKGRMQDYNNGGKIMGYGIGLTEYHKELARGVLSVWRSRGYVKLAEEVNVKLI